MAALDGYFSVACCKKRRGVLKGVLICSACDFNHEKATGMPNGDQTRDVPDGTLRIYINKKD